MRLLSLSLVGLVVLVLGTAEDLRAGAQEEAAEARHKLRETGFKTDLADFDFSADHETTLRVAALTNAYGSRPIEVLEPCGSEAAIVAWKQPEPREEEGYQWLPPMEEVLATNRAALNRACAAALAGPIRFPLTAKHGSAMLLVHLGSLRNLAQMLAAGMVADLREQRRDAAWTNLLALTRLATAWEPEPIDISHLVRFGLAQMAWNAAWQALQARAWTDEQMAALQREWEAAEFFKGLPETAAFQRACAVDHCIRERATPLPGISLKETINNALESPGSVAYEAKYRWERIQYRATGSYEDERDLLFYFRDREVELRKAVAASTWLEMRSLPGASNAVPFRSKHRSSTQSMLNTRQLATSLQLTGKSLLGRAAETEARRRLIIAAICLERYRRAHGVYPQELQALVPKVIKTVPNDFMDGKPLRYRLRPAGAFVLHSVGLDCVDDGGQLVVAVSSVPTFQRSDPFDSPDMVWPRAASDAEAESLRQEQLRGKAEQRKRLEQEAEEREREQEARRQEVIAHLGRIYTNGPTPKVNDPKVEGGLLSQVLRNKSAGPPLGLEQMLTLHQVITGREPEIATFELPLSYDAVTNLGRLRLFCDPDPAEDFAVAAEAQECERANNGNCRLVWNTHYDPPGQHFLQAEFRLEDWRGRSRRRNRDLDEIIVKGPLFSFVSTNVLQFFPLGDVFTDKGAFFHVKLARPVGSYVLKITSPTGEHVHTKTGSTTNGHVELEWDLLYDGGKRYTNESFQSTWTVTFPDAPATARTNQP